ncbi:hypothetical protein GOHSU_43_00220 [Gordonia hirsuta DSM 44140 = NBRC 16056]|uniref:Uncharacterized protein n=1 Tax=Gordonia hirsuta DSM 44140 = NBRC 16056 TaxID=1121927 RepID=L7LEV9_9ACTN|nr:hypothetical protein GOHSU_43_00220 [Gordonia hirsuta DSM 44140 = NBRC 16056]
MSLNTGDEFESASPQKNEGRSHDHHRHPSGPDHADQDGSLGPRHPRNFVGHMDAANTREAYRAILEAQGDEVPEFVIGGSCIYSR